MAGHHLRRSTHADYNVASLTASEKVLRWTGVGKHPKFKVGAVLHVYPFELQWNKAAVTSRCLRDSVAGTALALLTDEVGSERFRVTGKTPAHSKFLVKFSLQAAQTKVCESILFYRTTLVWGPPGSGKTYTLAAMLLAFFGTHALLKKNACTVLITAATDKAIDNLLKKISELQGDAQRVTLIRLWSGFGDVPAGPWKPEKAWKWKPPDDSFVIVGSTVWQAVKTSATFDVVVVDEASQIVTYPIAIVLSKLGTRGRLVVCGDPLQLPAVGMVDEGNMPTKPAVRRFYLPILQCLMGATSASVDPEELNELEKVLSLQDNFRMTNEIAKFVQSSLYKSYKPQGDVPKLLWLTKGQRMTGSDAFALRKALPVSVRADVATWLRVMNAVYNEDHSTSPHTLPPLSYVLSSAAQEAVHVKALVAHVMQYGLTAGPIFVITPTHHQRAAVNQALATIERPHLEIEVGTVDTMQGREAPVVIVCYAFEQQALYRGADFYLDIRRVNVAVTRAQQLFIFLGTQAVFDSWGGTGDYVRKYRKDGKEVLVSHDGTCSMA
eukprot:TRINITY_DN10483_c0_g1_i1.p1 TRINITY_DN10483_c0_g1~~TRINITY_DN10483_c0_g1_i1.p1  ORF type:complete len:552 (-),score=66.16 TRINITY_DN10483_c0_g1_i1:110-1765(-)